MVKLSLKNGFVAHTVLGCSLLLCIAGLVTATIVRFPSGHRASVSKIKTAAPSTEAFLPLVSLDPPSLAAANVSGEETAAVQAVVATRLTDGWSNFQALVAARNSAQRTAERPPVTVNGQTPTPAQLKQAAATAQAAVSAWLEETRQAAITDLSVDQKAALNQIYANHDSALPMEFRILSYSQADMVKLREALTQKGRAAELGESLDQDATTLIGSYEGAGVLAARARIAQLN